MGGALVVFAATSGDTFRFPVALALAGAGAAAVGGMSWFGTGSRRSRALWLAADLIWASVAVVAASLPESGLTLLFALVSFAAGVNVGRRASWILTGGASVSLAATAFLMGMHSTQPLALVAQLLLVAVMGLVGNRMRTQIDARDQALESASRALERLRLDTDSIIQNLGSGLISLNVDGRVVHCNPMACDMLQLDGDVVRGTSLYSALPGEMKPLAEALEASLTSGQAAQRMYVVVMRNGERLPLGLSTTVLLGPDGETTGVAALFQDLTRIEREEAMQRRKDRLAAIGELAAGIAHEIRNSIQPVSGSVQILSQELKPEGERAKLFEVIERETENIQRFVTALLNYTHAKPLHLTEIDLKDLAERTVDDLRLSGRELPAIKNECEELLACGDLGQLNQVLRNLVANAVSMVDDRGTIVLRTGTRNGRPWISVEDDGPGIAEEDRDRVFDPFYTTRAGGTGLGLPLARRIIEEHDGELELTTRKGGGACFRVLLPEAQELEKKQAA